MKYHKFTTCLFIAFLIVGFLIRLNILYSINYTEDGSRDFLVAHHIVKYREFPLIGPATNFEPIKNSPFYFYFLSIFLQFNDSYAFLGLINIFFQVATIIIIYLIAKNMFDQATALIASTLFNFSQAILIQSSHLWQPWMAQPFVNLSYLLLLLAYLKKNYQLLTLSVFVFITAGVMHRSTFLLIPLFSFLVFIILKKYIKHSYKYTLLIVYSLIFATLLNLPLLMYYTSHPIPLPISANQSSSFITLFKDNLLTLLTSLVLVKPNNSLNLNAGTTLVLISSLIIFCLYQTRKVIIKRNFLIILILAILGQIIFTSGLKSDSYRYLTPILGLLIILISAAINSIFSKNIILNIAKVLMVVILINLASPKLYNYLSSLKYLSNTKPRISPAVKALEEKILSLQKEKNLSNLNFFNIISIKDGHAYGFVDAFFWASLESDLNTKLVKLDNNRYGYQTVNDNQYIFLICYRYENPNLEKSSCKDGFAKKFPYQIIEKIYSKSPLSPFSVYLTKKET